ncbi:MAG: VanZ family protein [Acidobacteria bacterium]|nr:VanZ family protein [Acidobacteriota bacterium]
MKLLLTTLLPGSPSVFHQRNNLVPFRTISQQLTSAVGMRAALTQIGGNLALLAPLGFLLGLLKVSFRRAVAGMALLSVAIETLQVAVVPNRAGDIDDLLLNMAGGAAGYLAGALVARLISGLPRAPASRLQSPRDPH